MSKAKPKKKNDENEIDVKLKPILGMKPGFYLTVLYAVILFALLFLLLFVPGLIRNGTHVYFSTDPGNASVWVDDTFAGTTPCSVFINKGEHRLVIQKPFHTGVDDTVSIDGRVVGSLFAPRKEKRLDILSVSGLDEYLSWVHQEYSSWALIDNFHPSYQPPSLLSDTIIGLFSEERNTADSEKIYSFLLSAMTGVNNNVILRDFMSALFLYASGGNGAASVSIIQVLDIVEKLIAAEPLLPLWLYRAVPVEYRQAIGETSWFSQAISYAASFEKAPRMVPAVTGSPVTIIGSRFIPVAGGNFTMGSGRLDTVPLSESEVFSRLNSGFPIPHPAEVNDFYILAAEVTVEQYSAFLNENSEWKKENIQALMDQEKVTDDYLYNWGETGPGDPVTYVSWYAAQAYCTWLGMKLPGMLDSYTVRLPSEKEWEWAAGSVIEEGSSVFVRNGGLGPAAVSDSGMNSLGLFGLEGNVWEWCDNWYSNFPYLLSQPEGIWPGAEKSVRGGCWANNEEEIGIETRGSQPPQWCTPFLGFRPVIVRDHVK